MNKHYKRHNIEIIKKFDGYTYIIDNIIINVGWTSADSAFSAAKTAIDKSRK